MLWLLWLKGLGWWDERLLVHLVEGRGLLLLLLLLLLGGGGGEGRRRGMLVIIHGFWLLGRRKKPKSIGGF